MSHRIWNNYLSPYSGINTILVRMNKFSHYHAFQEKQKETNEKSRWNVWGIWCYNFGEYLQAFLWLHFFLQNGEFLSYRTDAGDENLQQTMNDELTDVDFFLEMGKISRRL